MVENQFSLRFGKSRGISKWPCQPLLKSKRLPKVKPKHREPNYSKDKETRARVGSSVLNRFIPYRPTLKGCDPRQALKNCSNKCPSLTRSLKGIPDKPRSLLSLSRTLRTPRSRWGNKQNRLWKLRPSRTTTLSFLKLLSLKSKALAPPRKAP